MNILLKLALIALGIVVLGTIAGVVIMVVDHPSTVTFWVVAGLGIAMFVLFELGLHVAIDRVFTAVAAGSKPQPPLAFITKVALTAMALLMLWLMGITGIMVIGGLFVVVVVPFMIWGTPVRVTRVPEAVWGALVEGAQEAAFESTVDVTPRPTGGDGKV